MLDGLCALLASIVYSGVLGSGYSQVRASEYIIRISVVANQRRNCWVKGQC